MKHERQADRKNQWRDECRSEKAKNGLAGVKGLKIKNPNFQWVKPASPSPEEVHKAVSTHLGNLTLTGLLRPTVQVVLTELDVTAFFDDSFLKLPEVVEALKETEQESSTAVL